MIKVKSWKISDLKSAEYNPRQISKRQFEHLKESIFEFGFLIPVVVNTHPDRFGVVVGGHQRIKVEEEAKKKTVPCVEVNLPIEKERELNIRLNQNGGTFDFDILANQFDQDELLDFGFEEWQLSMFNPVEDPNPIPEGPEEKFKPIKLMYDKQTRETIMKGLKTVKNFAGLQNASEVVQFLLEQYLSSAESKMSDS